MIILSGLFTRKTITLQNLTKPLVRFQALDKMNKKVYQISAKGLAPFVFEAKDLPQGCVCNEQTGDITCDENTPEGVHYASIKATDAAGRSTGYSSINFSWSRTSPFNTFMGLSDYSIFATFSGVTLCPGNCSAENDYTTYEKIPPNFINGRRFELDFDSSRSSETDPDIGAVWHLSSADNFYVKRTDWCEFDPYGSPTELSYPIVIEAKIRKTSAGYRVEATVNKTVEDGGQIFDTEYIISDPATQFFGKQFANRNTTCNEAGTPQVIGVGGTVEFSPMPCEAP